MKDFQWQACWIMYVCLNANLQLSIFIFGQGCIQKWNESFIFRYLIPKEPFVRENSVLSDGVPARNWSQVSAIEDKGEYEKHA